MSAGAAFDRRRFELVARLAAMLARPAAFVHAQRLALAPLDADDVARLAAHPAFARPVSRALREALGLAGPIVAPAFLDTLASSPAARAAVMILTAAPATLDRLAHDLAATVLAHRLVGVVRRAEREALRDSLGAEAMQIATQEAPLVYARLRELDGLPADASLAALLPSRERLVDFGRLAFEAVLARLDRGLAALFALRSPPERLPQNFVRTPSGADVEGVARFVQRREPAWSSIIA